MAAPRGPVTARRIQPKVYSSGMECDRKRVAGHSTKGCVRTTRYAPARYWLTIGRAGKVEVKSWQYKSCQVGERYPECARD
ncbi:hypothetical protein DP939_00200 [Spongiactinospora rosea]|uniref:Uncharacterized protein n=1 Tax=Spongiactinospora rosea TaxID=2248750 RepID=A0A366M4M1_9ACTN|nr:hypothetical protein [Spongiactinospora rosea]RBQ21198.1 hypothetical protein DP939_00200 [Spongiactinospora rosea]